MVRELNLAAVTLFDEFDRISLASCMAPRVTPDGATVEPWETWRRQVAEAEGWFASHIDAFLPAAPLAGATLAACRPDLDEDEALWDTVLKHRSLEETIEEAAAPFVLSRLGPHDLQSVQHKNGRQRPARVARSPCLIFPGQCTLVSLPLLLNSVGRASSVWGLAWGTRRCLTWLIPTCNRKCW